MDLYEKRKHTLFNLLYFTLIAAAYFLFFEYAFWLVAPFIFAFLVAMILQKPIRAINKKTKIKKGFLAVIAVILILAIIITSIVLVGYRLAVEFKGFYDYVITRADELPDAIISLENWIISKISFLPDKLEKTAIESIRAFADKLLLATSEEMADAAAAEAAEAAQTAAAGGTSFDLSMLATPLGGLWSTAKQIPAVLTAILISIIACFFISADYDNLTNLIKKNISEEHEIMIVKIKRIFGDIIGKMLKSYVTIIFVTFCELAIGLNVLKLVGIYTGGYILIISICTALLDILPVFGTGTVMVPWAVYSLITGKTGLGIGLLVVYATITVVRQILEPRLVAMNVGLPPVATLAGMYIGLQLFGVLGIFIVPITFVLIKVLNSEGIIHLWGKRQEQSQVNAEVSVPTEAAADESTETSTT